MSLGKTLGMRPVHCWETTPVATAAATAVTEPAVVTKPAITSSPAIPEEKNGNGHFLLLAI